ncbi:hypothetical protein [Methanolobus bombayensis]|uniref:hypothetical protein n=1 Tax=Methanolobus bombayensis TaxID=38023 RepID=UPI001AE501D8|nr:hypothetical protein [Methanolobus bombayensis]MBP1909796.1 hypothetical protein [Methanolobus bombayensis]
MIQSILCEGLHDIWFFDELSQKQGLKPRKVHRDLSKFQELVGKCSRYIMEQEDNPLIILGDDGREGVFGTYLKRAVKELVGKHPENITIIVVVDDDHRPLEKHMDNIQKTLDELKSSSSYLRTVGIAVENNVFTISHPKNQYNVNVEIYTIPDSLERLTLDYCYSEKKLKKREKGNIQEEVRSVATKYYDGNKEEMFRNYAIECHLQNEEWAKTIITRICS